MHARHGSRRIRTFSREAHSRSFCRCWSTAHSGIGGLHGPVVVGHTVGGRVLGPDIAGCIAVGPALTVLDIVVGNLPGMRLGCAVEGSAVDFAFRSYHGRGYSLVHLDFVRHHVRVHTHRCRC